MDDIDFLEHGGAGTTPFSVRVDGYTIPLPDPREQHYQWVLAALHLKHVPWTPGEIPDWQRALVFERWRAAWELPDFSSARRLAYLVDKYRAPITSDLTTFGNGLDLGQLWRARKWQRLLDVIDRLPAHSWYASNVSMDPEHAQMMAEHIQRQRSSGNAETEPTGPSLTTWTPEVAALTNVLDAVRGVQHAVIAVQAGNKAGDPPKPAPRPVTPFEQALKLAQHRDRKAKHESLVARMVIRTEPEPQEVVEEPVAPPEPEAPKGPSPADVARVLARRGAVKG